jgi:hypothetical protein
MKRRAFIILAGLAALWPRKARALDVKGPYIRATGSTVNFPQYAIGWRLTHGGTGETVDDMTEDVGKHVLFPNVLTALTDSERVDFWRCVSDFLIRTYRTRKGL